MKFKISLVLVTILTLVYAGYLSWFSILRHAKTNSSRFDLGNTEQVVWNTTHGRWLQMTDPYGTATVSRLTFHIDPLLLIFVPFYAAWPHTETLLIIQTLIIASGGIALWLIARRRLSECWSVILAAIYFLHPAVTWGNMFDVHAVTLVPALVLWSVYFAQRKKYWIMTMFAILAIFGKEEIGLMMPILGIYLWRWQGTKRWGLAWIILPLLWASISFLIILPHTRAATGGDSEVYRTVFGDSASAVLRGAVTHPTVFFKTLLAHQNLRYAWELIAPTGLTALVSPWILGAVPDYVINALSLKPAQHLILSQYPSGLLPWIFLAMVYGVWRIRRIYQPLSPTRRSQYIDLVFQAWVIGWALWSAWSYGPFPGTPNDQTRFATWRNPYAGTVATWATKIPSTAAVSVTNNIGAHFAQREHLYSFPLGVSNSDYLVVLEGHATPVVATQQTVSADITQYRANPSWVTVVYDHELTILRRSTLPATSL